MLKNADVLGKMSKAENFQKKSKKRVDFCVQIWYSIKAPRERGSERAEAVEEKFQKK